MVTIHVTDRAQHCHTLVAGEGSTLMEVLRDEGMGVEAICGGQCACATCHCFIDEAWVPQVGVPGADEGDLLACLDHYDPRCSRLACQIEVSHALHGLQLTVAPDE